MNDEYLVQVDRLPNGWRRWRWRVIGSDGRGVVGAEGHAFTESGAEKARRRWMRASVLANR